MWGLCITVQLLEPGHLRLPNHNLSWKQKILKFFCKKRTINQGCCPTGSQSPEAPTICLSVTRISNKEPEQVPIKTYDSHANFWLMNDKIPYSFSAHEMKLENVW